MKIECPNCQGVFVFHNHAAANAGKEELNCPHCGSPIDEKRLSAPSEVDKPSVATTRCAIYSARNKLRLFDIPLIEKTKSGHWR